MTENALVPLPIDLVTEDNTVIGPAPRVLMYDTQAHRVSSIGYLPAKTNPLILRSIFLNTVNSHINIYFNSLRKILETCEQHKKRLSTGPIILDENLANSYANRIHARLEDVTKRLSAWDGTGQISVLFPYSEIVFKEGSSDKIDTARTMAWIDGMWFVLDGVEKETQQQE